MDAIDYSNDRRSQYLKESKDREINKCMTAFSNLSEKNIITGDWGCGAFKGNHKLKLIIQVYCARMCSKRLYYYSNTLDPKFISTYNDMNLKKMLEYIYTCDA